MIFEVFVGDGIVVGWPAVVVVLLMNIWVPFVRSGLNADEDVFI